MSLIETVADDRPEHPVDVVERLAAINEWTFDRAEEDEISILVAGDWANYDVAFTWLPDLESLHVACSFDLKAPQRKRAAVGELIQLINEQLWLGHFDLWREQDLVMFRHSLCLAGGRERERRPVLGGGEGGGLGLRDLFSGVPVRALGRPDAARGDRLRRLRDPRRGLTAAAGSAETRLRPPDVAGGCAPRRGWRSVAFACKSPPSRFPAREDTLARARFGVVSMAVPRRKTSPSRRGMRRSADAIKAPAYVEDKDSGELRRPHHIDLKSGMYRGRQVLKPKSTPVDA